MPSSKAVIIGSGIAGMASAIRLSLQGFAVEVFEKNAFAGGKLHAISNNDFHFDAGPSLFTQPQNLHELFNLAGEPMQDYLPYEQVDLACKYFYENGTVINAWADADRFAAELHTATGEDASRIKQYLQQAEKLYENIGTIFLNNSLHKSTMLFSAPLGKALRSTKPAYLFNTLHGYNENFFKQPATVQLFDRFATYNGSDPYQAPGMLSLIPHLEFNQGVYYPKGGMISITNALLQLAQKVGVVFHFNTAVKQIVQEHKRVKGVVVNDTLVPADIVVSNADVYFTYKHLLADEAKARQVLKQERSSSAIIFYWGIKNNFQQLHLHNIFFSNNYKKEFHHLFKTQSITNDPTVYINITAKMEAGHAPAGKENWFVMINAPANTGQDWHTLVAKARTAVMEKLSRLLGEAIEPLIEAETIADPQKIEQDTASYMGSLYGTSSNSRLAAFLRHPNFSRHTRGLYFAGGSVHPGGGIPLCLKSAAIVDRLVAADRKTVL